MRESQRSGCVGCPACVLITQKKCRLNRIDLRALPVNCVAFKHRITGNLRFISSSESYLDRQLSCTEQGEQKLERGRLRRDALETCARFCWSQVMMTARTDDCTSIAPMDVGIMAHISLVG